MKMVYMTLFHSIDGGSKQLSKYLNLVLLIYYMAHTEVGIFYNVFSQIWHTIIQPK